jgi:hypothetical protein
MNDTEVQWTTAAPLWDSVADLGAETRQSFRRPAILRFASDEFMNEFVSLLNSNPSQLKAFRALPETWRGPITAPQIESIEKLPRLAQKLQRSKLAIERKAVAKILAVPDQSTALTTLTITAPRPVLKLYQPAHQRYYLIGAALVCRVPGQPDRHIETGNQERATYVVRKVVPAAGQSIFDSNETTWTEYALVSGGWQRVTDAQALMSNEEQQPLFAVNYLQDDERRRRVLAGLIPVGKREAYVGAPERSSDNQIVIDPSLPLPDKRTLLFMAQVTEPWKRLIERAFAWRKMKTPAGQPLTNDEALSGDALNKSLKDNREQIQTISWYALLDFAKLLYQYIPNVWESILNQSLSSPLTTDQSKLIDALINTEIGSGYAAALHQPLYPDKNGIVRAVVPSIVISNLRDALQQIQGGLPFSPTPAKNIEDNLETIVMPYDRNPSTGTTPWPSFLFPLADPKEDGPLPPAKPGASPYMDTDPLVEARTNALLRIDYLVELIEAALPTEVPTKTPPPLIAAQPVMRIDAPTYFVIRCVFERPNCGPLKPIVISDPTEPFLMAGFFDPDAPARPIRIALPIDTTLAGLRKFDKNTAFMISDVLCGQISRAQGLGLGDLIRTVLPWPLHKDLDVPDGGPCKDDAGFSLGMICSLSIPIITICALILLMIMVNLLDIIFHWVPYFIMCLPFPKFKGKPST